MSQKKDMPNSQQYKKGDLREQHRGRELGVSAVNSAEKLNSCEFKQYSAGQQRQLEPENKEPED